MKVFNRNGRDEIRAPQALPDEARFAVLRKQVLKSDAAHRRREHGFVPARHVDGEDLVRFVTFNSVPGLTYDERDRGL